MRMAWRWGADVRVCACSRVVINKGEKRVHQLVTSPHCNVEAQRWKHKEINKYTVITGHDHKSIIEAHWEADEKRSPALAGRHYETEKPEPKGFRKNLQIFKAASRLHISLALYQNSARAALTKIPSMMGRNSSWCRCGGALFISVPGGI